jgi:DnaJ like chaperone protein
MHGEGRHGLAFLQRWESRVKKRMRWAGKVVGGLVGAAFGVPGAIVGAILGHTFDEGGAGRSAQASDEPLGELIFETTFAVMGFLAKADGRVSEAEIDAARGVMRSLRLGEEDVQRAIRAYRWGKTPDYPVDERVATLRARCGAHREVLRFFLEVQMRAALAGNGLTGPVRPLLSAIGERLGFSSSYIVQLEAWLRDEAMAATQRPPDAEKRLARAYSSLGISADCSDAEVKKAYRRQMSENHPDKLVSRGLPESMQDMAKETTQRIREAYETICRARGIR